MVLSEPDVRVLHYALKRLVRFKSLSVILKRLVNVTKVQLTISSSRRLLTGLCWRYLTIHLAVDPVHPRHHVPWTAVVDLLILIRVCNAGKGKLIVDSSRVIAEHVAQRRRDRGIVKRVALTSEQSS